MYVLPLFALEKGFGTSSGDRALQLPVSPSRAFVSQSSGPGLRVAVILSLPGARE